MKPTAASFALLTLGAVLLFGPSASGPVRGQEPRYTGKSPTLKQLTEDWKALEQWDESLKTYQGSIKDIFQQGNKPTETTTGTGMVRRQPGYVLRSLSVNGVRTTYARSPSSMFAVTLKKSAPSHLLQF